MSTPFPDPIIKPFSNTGDNAPPPLGPISTAANQETGFPILESTPLNAGGIPVTREEFNGAFNFYTKQILALVSGCRFTFSQELSDEQNGYPMGAVLYCASDNSLQRSLINNNTANFITDPSYINDGENWTAVTIDNIWCENLAIKDQGELALLDNTNTYGITFKASNSMAASQDYILPYFFPSSDATPNFTPQALTADFAGNLYWTYMREFRITYIQDTIVTHPGTGNLKFSTLYDKVNIPTGGPTHYNPSTGVFTPLISATYIIEINLQYGGAAGAVELNVFDDATNTQLASLAFGSTSPIGLLNGCVYLKLTNGQAINFQIGAITYGDPLPYVSNQFSIRWFSGLP